MDFERDLSPERWRRRYDGVEVKTEIKQEPIDVKPTVVELRSLPVLPPVPRAPVKERTRIPLEPESMHDSVPRSNSGVMVEYGRVSFYAVARRCTHGNDPSICLKCTRKKIQTRVDPVQFVQDFRAKGASMTAQSIRRVCQHGLPNLCCSRCSKPPVIEKIRIPVRFNRVMSPKTPAPISAPVAAAVRHTPDVNLPIKKRKIRE